MTSQVDIAKKVQRDAHKAHEKEKKKGGLTGTASTDAKSRATQFDGNPNPQADQPSKTFSPRDDTPAVLKKRSGPRDDQK